MPFGAYPSSQLSSLELSQKSREAVAKLTMGALTTSLICRVVTFSRVHCIDQFSSLIFLLYRLLNFVGYVEELLKYFGILK